MPSPGGIATAGSLRYCVLCQLLIRSLLVMSSGLEGLVVNERNQPQAWRDLTIVYLPLLPVRFPSLSQFVIRLDTNRAGPNEPRQTLTLFCLSCHLQNATRPSYDPTRDKWSSTHNLIWQKEHIETIRDTARYNVSERASERASPVSCT